VTREGCHVPAQFVQLPNFFIFVNVRCNQAYKTITRMQCKEIGENVKQGEKEEPVKHRHRTYLAKQEEGGLRFRRT
jgi:hypothetical protein